MSHRGNEIRIMKTKRLIMGAVLMIPCLAFAQQPLSLDECRQLAVKNNKSLQISSEKINVADNNKSEAFTKYFPQVSAKRAYLWNQKDLNLLDMDQLGAAIGSQLGGLSQLPMVQNAYSMVNDIQHLDITNIWIGNIALVQPVFMGGKIITYNQITQYAKDLAKSMHETELQGLLYKTDETYWQVVSLVNKKKLADKYVSLLEKMDSDISQMIDQGLATKADGLSVKVKLNEAQMTQTKVDNGLSLTRMLLAEICGLPINDSIRLADEDIDRVPYNTPESNADINEAFMNRSELKSLETATKIYQKKERLVLADLLPNVALAANYFVTNPSSFNGFKNKFGGMFNVGVLVSIPMSDRWGGTYKRHAAKAETTIANLQLADARDKIELEVNQSVYKVNEAKKKLTASSKNMENAEENLKDANFGFNEGVIPALNLMEAQTGWVKAKSELIDSEIEVKLTNIYLDKAMGRLSLNN